MYVTNEQPATAQRATTPEFWASYLIEKGFIKETAFVEEEPPSAANDYNMNAPGYIETENGQKFVADVWEARSNCGQLSNLCRALLLAEQTREKFVFAVCTKQSRTLDTGAHYFSIYYCTGGAPQRFCISLPALAEYVGFKKTRWSSGLSFRSFSSSTIGMSRLLSATDGLFSFLKRACGLYCQVDLL